MTTIEYTHKLLLLLQLFIGVLIFGKHIYRMRFRNSLREI